MRRKIHQHLMHWQPFVVIVVLLGIGLFVFWARSRQLPLPIIIGSSSALVIGTLLVGGYYYKWAWTGFSDYAYPKAEGVEFYHRKTLWDWLQLLIIPSVLAGAALLFNAQSTQTQLDITTDNQREATLQAYIDNMSELLLDGKLRTSERGSEIRSVARTRTLSTLRQLDGTRRGQVLQFLQESQLISGTDAVIALAGSNLSEADLPRANLRGANLQEVSFMDANLLEGHLPMATLRRADLNRAVLRRANLVRAFLEGADLQGADLQGADLNRAVLIGADLQGANLQGAFLDKANIAAANFQEADLTKAVLNGADLEGADLTKAVLNGADLEGADLTRANLEGAKISPEQLAQAASLKGATMPDGSIHP